MQKKSERKETEKHEEKNEEKQAKKRKNQLDQLNMTDKVCQPIDQPPRRKTLTKKSQAQCLQHLLITPFYLYQGKEVIHKYNSR